MRLGGPTFQEYKDPEEWVKVVKEAGFSAAYCPVDSDASDDIIKSYEKSSKDNDIVIAETGAWSNPLSTDEKERNEALRKCQEQLSLADRINARCCVNISGSRGEQWDGHHPDNLTRDTFDLIVETIRKIIDAVKPARSFYALETMPWMYPDSPGSYLELIKAIDRKQLAVHLDPVNIICSPQRYYNNTALLKECFQKLGPYIKSCHAKDIILEQKLTTHLDETRPGQGNLDYKTFIQELEDLNPDIPLMLEHLPDEKEYKLAQEHIQKVASDIGIAIK